MLSKLEEYAKLLIEVGLNVQKGQDVVINSPVDCADFARMCVKAAFAVGARDVNVFWRDDVVAREHWLHADDEVFDEFPAWLAERNIGFAKKNCAWMNISATDPENLKGVDPDRISRFNKVNSVAMREFRTMSMNDEFPWCIASLPVKSWAKKVFPDCDESTAMNKLLDAILSAVRITGDGKAVEKWREHCDFIDRQAKKLNDLNFTELHYTNSLGTDLHIKLPEGHIWTGGADNSKSGIRFVANMPTEEIFTAPMRTGVDGIVYASKPLCIDGNLVENFHLVLKEGKIVEVHAQKGEDFLKKAIATDENSCYLGEVALVPYDSPISNSGLLFYNTLFDENASCHLAFGAAYPSCIQNGGKMTTEELLAHGLNDSNEHCDFMVGTSDLRIVGKTHDGKEITVFDNGNFAI